MVVVVGGDRVAEILWSEGSAVVVALDKFQSDDPGVGFGGWALPRGAVSSYCRLRRCLVFGVRVSTCWWSGYQLERASSNWSWLDTITSIRCKDIILINC